MAPMQDCVFCRVVAGGLPSRKVLETEDVLAFEDINPSTPIHVLVIPKAHIASSLAEVEEKDKEILAKLQLAAGEIARKLKMTDFTYKTNSGKAAGQTVWHLHYHLQGGFERGED